MAFSSSAVSHWCLHLAPDQLQLGPAVQEGVLARALQLRPKKIVLQNTFFFYLRRCSMAPNHCLYKVSLIYILRAVFIITRSKTNQIWQMERLHSVQGLECWSFRTLLNASSSVLFWKWHRPPLHQSSLKRRDSHVMSKQIIQPRDGVTPKNNRSCAACSLLVAVAQMLRCINHWRGSQFSSDVQVQGCWCQRMAGCLTFGGRNWARAWLCWPASAS